MPTMDSQGLCQHVFHARFPCLFSMPCGQVAVAVANATMPQLEERLMEEAQRQNEAVEMAREAAMLEVQPSRPCWK